MSQFLFFFFFFLNFGFVLVFMDFHWCSRRMLKDAILCQQMRLSGVVGGAAAASDSAVGFVSFLERCQNANDLLN